MKRHQHDKHNHHHNGQQRKKPRQSRQIGVYQPPIPGNDSVVQYLILGASQ